MANDRRGARRSSPTEDAQKAPRARRPGPARQTLLDAAEGRETVLQFDSAELAKGAAYGWWGARRRAGLVDKVAVSLDTTAMTVTIGPRPAAKAEKSTEPTATDVGNEPEAGQEPEEDDE